VCADQRARSSASSAAAQTATCSAETALEANGTAVYTGRSGAFIHDPRTAFALMIAGAALQALARNKMRSALTMLGVFIGVAALIAMVAVGQGANEAVRKQIESLGTNMFVVLPGASRSGGARGGFGGASTVTGAGAEARRAGWASDAGGRC